MYDLAQIILSLALFLCLALCALGISRGMNEGAGVGRFPFNFKLLSFMETASWLLFTALAACLLILLAALFKVDLALLYSALKVNVNLPWVYRLGALWGGAEGSLLFWAGACSGFVLLFQHSRAYKNLPQATARYFWVFFFLISAFFLFLLVTFSNPFLALPYMENAGNSFNSTLGLGAGLNPMLRHPAMLVHPPILLLGYAALLVPACLGLARLLSGPRVQFEIYPLAGWLFLAWLLLTGGIVLGMWWAYSEAGWGGYWTWDAVENTSLLPWLAVTAGLHSTLLERKYEHFFKLNNFLCVICLLSTFFATFVVRSGIVNSKHGFGLGNSGLVWIGFIAILLAVAVITMFFYSKKEEVISPLFSRTSLMCLNIFVLAGMAVILSTGSMWPFLSKVFSGQSYALQSSFFVNSLFPLLVLLLGSAVVAPYLGWREGVIFRRSMLANLFVFVASAVFLYCLGYQKPAPLLLSAVSIALIFSLPLAVFVHLKRLPLTRILGCLAHAGVGVFFLGIAFSSGYKQEWLLPLEPGQSVVLKNAALKTTYLPDYSFRYQSIKFGEGKDYHFVQLKLEVSGREQGEIILERRAYPAFDNFVLAPVHFEGQFFQEMLLVFASLNKDNSVVLKVSVYPFIELVWLGAALLCAGLLPLGWRVVKGKL